MNLNLPMVIRLHVRVWLTRVITVKQIEIALNFSKGNGHLWAVCTNRHAFPYKHIPIIHTVYTN